MANSTCHFKKEINPPPILPKCKHNLTCIDYTHSHRFGFYHDTFDYHHRERMNFLLKASNYSLSKKKQESTFSGKYLWEQFSADLKNTVYHDFLIYTYMYIIHLDDQNYTDLMSIKQAFSTLEENAITGIYYLNVAFMMWVFNFSTLTELQDFLTKQIEKKMIVARFDIHFKKLLEMIDSVPRKELNPAFVSLLGDIDMTKLKTIYSEFMLSDKYEKKNGQEDVFAVEKQILDFQHSIFPNRESYIISNSSLCFIIDKLIPKSEKLITGQLF